VDKTGNSSCFHWNLAEYRSFRSSIRFFARIFGFNTRFSVPVPGSGIRFSPAGNGGNDNLAVSPGLLVWGKNVARVVKQKSVEISSTDF
jgi:hypothetical protein